MPDRYLVITVKDEPLKVQKDLNDHAQQGYGVVGVVPGRPGVPAFIILEKE
jgi:hypothetical protein